MGFMRIVMTIMVNGMTIRGNQKPATGIVMVIIGSVVTITSNYLAVYRGKYDETHEP